MLHPARLGAGQKLALTANRLLDGVIVWRDAAGAWWSAFDRAALLDADEAEAALAGVDAQKDGVVGVYKVAVTPGAPPAPATMRERIRAFGPTV